MESVKNPLYADLTPQEVNALLLGRTVDQLKAEGWTWQDPIWMPPVMERIGEVERTIPTGAAMFGMSMFGTEVF